MKFRIIHLGYRSTPDYPYDYRIELTEYNTDERDRLTEWLNNNKIPHTTAGRNTGSVLYMKSDDADAFKLVWQT